MFHDRPELPGIRVPASTWALVPLKSSDRAKSRLAEVLDTHRRRELFFSLAEQVILALSRSNSVDFVAVVTASREVAAFARGLGATPILQAADVGMSPAIELAMQSLQPLQPRRVLIVPGDLPLITAGAVDEICDAQLSSDHVVLVPDRRHEGTNAMLCSPPRMLAPRFGTDSFARHLSLARASGVVATVMESEELALDLDSVDDLTYLHSLGTERLTDILAPRHEPLRAPTIG